jgi:hypothetical protein
MSVAADARQRLDHLRQGIADLRDRNYQGLEDVLAARLLIQVYNAAQIGDITAYLRTYWFSETTGWWPSFQPITSIYAQGLLQTLALSLASKPAPRPIDSYWLMGHTHVEMVNVANPRQVTLLIATPAPPVAAGGGIMGATSEAWVTLRRAGNTQSEIDPATGQTISGGTELRVRTFRVQNRR